MSSRFECQTNKKHKNHFKRFDFLMSVVKNKEFTCRKCKSKVNYIATQFYPNHKKEEVLILRKVKKIEANSRYYPFLLRLENKWGKTVYWLQYWVKVNGKWKYGQYAPLLNKEQMKKVHRNL